MGKTNYGVSPVVKEVAGFIESKGFVCVSVGYSNATDVFHFFNTADLSYLSLDRTDLDQEDVLNILNQTKGSIREKIEKVVERKISDEEFQHHTSNETEEYVKAIKEAISEEAVTLTTEKIGEKKQ